MGFRSFGWGITADGLNRGVLVFFKVMGGVAALSFLILTTPVNRLFAVFNELHLPTELVDLAILMYRYIFLFWMLQKQCITLKNKTWI